MSLGRLTVVRKSGEEPLHANGLPLGGSLLDFWRWSASDLMSNATRGRLAEYLVYRAIGATEDSIRGEWDAFDLTSPAGIRVEVKSAAFIQTWQQTRESAITFRIPKTRAWSEKTRRYEFVAKRQADVYVFALLHEREVPDPLDVRHWTFYVVSSRTLDTRVGSPDSITLAALVREVGCMAAFETLAATIKAVAQL